MKETFGVRGDGYSMAVDRALSEFGKETSFQRAADRFEEHYGWEVGRTTVLRRTETVAESAEQFVADRLEAGKERLEIPPRQRSPSADELIAQADGCHIRTGRKMTAKQARQETHNPEELQRFEDRDDDEIVRLQEWKEVRTGLVRRPGEVEPTYVCQRGEWSEVLGKLFGAECLHGWEFDTQVVAVADGAHGLKEAFEEWFAQLQFILDKPHLRDHLRETAEQLVAESQGAELVDDLHQWLDEKLTRIEAGEVQSVIADLTSLSERLHSSESTERLDRLIAHLTRFCHCVDYDTYEANDWPVGSGEVESAHKHIPQQRLKQPGACWREDNLNPMCALRLLKANDWWDDFWNAETDRRAAA